MRNLIFLILHLAVNAENAQLVTVKEGHMINFPLRPFASPELHDLLSIMLKDDSGTWFQGLIFLKGVLELGAPLIVSGLPFRLIRACISIVWKGFLKTLYQSKCLILRRDPKWKSAETGKLGVQQRSSGNCSYKIKRKVVRRKEIRHHIRCDERTWGKGWDFM